MDSRTCGGFGGAAFVVYTPLTIDMTSSSWLRDDCKQLYKTIKDEHKAVRVAKRGRTLRFSINYSWSVFTRYPNAQILEFGVHTGRDLCLIDRAVRQKENEMISKQHNEAASTDTERHMIHGFDSFRGLPEDWDNGKGYDAGTFDLNGVPPDLNEVRRYLSSKTKATDTYTPTNQTTGQLETNIQDNVKLHAGWFNDTVSPFFDVHTHPIAYIHADADLYSSTITFLQEICKRQLLVKGTVITFDEYANYPNWQQGEYKAWMEMVEQYDIEYRYICYHAPSEGKALDKNKKHNEFGYQSVSVVITSVPLVAS